LFRTPLNLAAFVAVEVAMYLSRTLWILPWLALSSGLAWAQKPAAVEQGYGIFSSQQDYFQFMGEVKRNPETRGMVDLINDMVLQRPVGWTSRQYGAASSTLGLLSDPRVREELEVMDDQYQQLQAMNEDIIKRAAGQLRALDFGDGKNLVDQIRRIQHQAEEDLQAVLLPHQLDRLRQLQARSRLRQRSLVDVITSEPYRSQLEISDRQSAELRQAEREVLQELEREIQALREKARQRLLETLKPAQREKAETLFGEAFDFGKGPNTSGKPASPQPGK
jgi:hypothetical protein